MTVIIARLLKYQADMSSCSGNPMKRFAHFRCKGVAGWLLIMVCAQEAPSVFADSLTIQAKSFIRTVDPTDPSQFDPDASCGLQAMSLVIDCGVKLGEDPLDGSAGSGDYRLQSQLTGQATCNAGMLSSWQLKPVSIDAGNEFFLIPASGDLAGPLSAVPGISGNQSTKAVTFTYRMRGQPNAAGNLLMKAVKPRTCTYIWHEVSGTLSCNGNMLVKKVQIRGSAFPSAKLWVDGQLAGEIKQGPFKDLWICDPGNSIYVK